MRQTESTRILDMIDKVSFYGLADISRDDVPKAWVQRTVSAADRLLKHHCRFFAVADVDLGDEVRFNREYKRQIDTPLEFAPWMDYRDTEAYGDFKYFWELPRLQHLITLAKAYYLTGENAYAEEVEQQLEAFVEQSPYLRGVNWIMPMEAAIRLVSLSWIVGFLRDYLQGRPATCGLIEQLILSHTDYITSNYAAYSSANNHLVGEVAGVFIAGVCFADLAGMTARRNKAFEILCREITHQFYDDGVNKEQAVHYQLFCSTFFLLAGLIGRQNGIPFPQEYWDRLERSAEFLCAISDKHGGYANFGDSDDGRAVLLSDDRDSEIQSMLATSAICFDRPDMLTSIKSLDEMSYWLLGGSAVERFAALKRNKAENKIPDWFPEGGYYVLRSGEPLDCVIVFDCGPLGFESIAAHGHADSLSFTMSLFGRSFFIDPGTYTYLKNDPYRSYFRSTAAHNTLTINSMDQSEMAGPFLWSEKANSFLEEFETSRHTSEVIGFHDGYLRLDSSVMHKRMITLDKTAGKVVITDTAEGQGRYLLRQYFHLAAECNLTPRDDHAITIENGGKRITFHGDRKLTMQWSKGCENPIAGWMSERYDEKIPTHTLWCSGEFSGNQCFTTEIELTV